MFRATTSQHAVSSTATTAPVAAAAMAGEYSGTPLTAVLQRIDDVLAHAPPAAATAATAKSEYESPPLAFFASSCPPPTPLASYAARLLRFTPGTDDRELAVALAIVARVLWRSGQPLDALTAHRLLAAAFSVAVKLMHDTLPLRFAQLSLVTGVEPAELARLEAALLQAADFMIVVTPDEIDAVCDVDAVQRTFFSGFACSSPEAPRFADSWADVATAAPTVSAATITAARAPQPALAESLDCAYVRGTATSSTASLSDGHAQLLSD